MKGSGGAVGHTGLRRSFSLKSTASVSASPNQQRRRHVTGGGDEKWHDALCSSYLKEYIQYLQSLGFLTLNITQAPQQRGLVLAFHSTPKQTLLFCSNLLSSSYLVSPLFNSVQCQLWNSFSVSVFPLPSLTCSNLSNEWQETSVTVLDQSVICSLGIFYPSF